MHKKVLFFMFFMLQDIRTNPWQCAQILLNKAQQIQPNIILQPCSDWHSFNFKPLPITDDHYLLPYQGTFQPTFIAQIPHGMVQGVDGNIIFQNHQIYDFVWQNCCIPNYQFQSINWQKTQHISGKVAVIAQAGHTFYFHWLLEILGRLALLEMHGVSYDYLYVPTYAPYMKETLDLWGVDNNKIICAKHDTLITADTLIVPSLVSKVCTNGCPRLAHYIPQDIISYVQQKLKNSVTIPDSQKFNDKIFISRQDASTRKILNEDDVFQLFENHGFSRYQLSKLSIQDQIILFAQAKMIVGTMGSGFSNAIFCSPDVCIVDIMQARKDGTIYYLCQTLGIDYRCFKTTEFISESDGQFDTVLPIDIIKSIIQQIL